MTSLTSRAFSFLLLATVFVFSNLHASEAMAAVQVSSPRLSPTSISTGQTTTVSFTVKSTTAINGNYVQVNLYNAAGTKVAVRDFTGQNFKANQSYTYQWKFTPSSSFKAGTFTVRIGVFNAQWKTLAWVNNAGRLVVKSAPVPPSNSDGGVATASKLTYYWTIYPADANLNTPLVPIYNLSNQVLARIPEDLAKKIAMEGSGFIPDGRLINLACDCAWPTSRFFVVNQATTPYGLDAQGKPLVPYRTIAVDTTLIPLGTKVFIREFKDRVMPDGNKHNGCFIAGDIGYGVKGWHIDLYARKYEDYVQIDSSLNGLDTVHVVPKSTNCP